jgi:chorismate mutase/prephenate dehydratase
VQDPKVKKMTGTAEKIVAYLGPEGTFCEQAALKYFSNSSVKLLPCPSITEVFTTVKKRGTRYGVVPLENSLQGSERTTLDLLLQSNLKVRGEVDIRVAHNLIAKPVTERKDIRIIVSHPLALAQCHNFLQKEFPRVELKETNSTAKAVQLLAELVNAGAIGTDVAARRYGMRILYKHIEDDFNNFTRFFILGRKDVEPTGRDKTSLVFSVKDEPGALYRILEAFVTRNINLTKIESRPERGKPWKYIFYLDFEGHRTEAKSIEALDDMAKLCIFVKTLGSYPRSPSNYE